MTLKVECCQLYIFDRSVIEEEWGKDVFLRKGALFLFILLRIQIYLRIPEILNKQSSHAPRLYIDKVGYSRCAPIVRKCRLLR